MCAAGALCVCGFAHLCVRHRVLSCVVEPVKRGELGTEDSECLCLRRSRGVTKAADDAVRTWEAQGAANREAVLLDVSPIAGNPCLLF